MARQHCRQTIVRILSQLATQQERIVEQRLVVIYIVNATSDFTLPRIRLSQMVTGREEGWVWVRGRKQLGGPELAMTSKVRRTSGRGDSRL